MNLWQKSAARRAITRPGGRLDQLRTLLKAQRIEEAAQLCETALTEGWQSFDPRDPVMLELRLGRVSIALQQGRSQDAVHGARELLPDLDRIVGPAHELTWRAHGLLIAALHAAGSSEAASAHYRDAITTYTLSAVDLGGRLHLNSAMAQVHASRAEFIEAHELLHSELVYARQGIPDANAAALEGSNAGCLANLGRYAEAESLLAAVHAWALTTPELDSRRVHDASCRTNLAFALLGLGRAVEAEAHARIAVGLFTAEGGPASPSTRSARSNFAWALAELGRADEAEAECRLLLAHLGAGHARHDIEHSTVLTTLGKALVALDRADEALPVLRDALDRISAAHPRSSWRTVRTTVELAAALDALGQRNEACEVLETTLAASDASPYADHPWALLARQRLDSLRPAAQPG